MNARWALGPEVKRSAITGGAMLYDTSRAGNLSADWFEPRYWEALGALDGSARGRAAARFVNAADGRRYVLRHYRRGGLMARFSADRFVWHGEEGTRPFAEWQLTYHLHRAGLPVPVPLAARYQRDAFTYRGDLITERLSEVVSLAACLRLGALSILNWIAIGRCVRRFHAFGVCHADLNAHNVLLGSEDSVFLIDFDRASLRREGLWCDGNLVRLRRSLEKIAYGLPSDRFTEADWHGLLDGYRNFTPPKPLPPGSPVSASPV